MDSIYINSCGESRQDSRHEYQWKTGEQRNADEEVNSLLERIRFDHSRLPDLIAADSRDPSIVFARYEGSLWLFVTKLPSRRRKGSQGETQYFSVLWQMKTEQEGLARAILVNLLRYYPSRREDFSVAEESVVPRSGAKYPVLMEILDLAIQFDDEHGFVLQPEEEIYRNCRDCLDWDATEILSKANLETWIGRLGHNCAKLRRELAYELQHFRMPAGEGALIVVTGALTERILERNRVWRGLTTMVESLDWVDSGSSRGPHTLAFRLPSWKIFQRLIGAGILSQQRDRAYQL